MTFTFAPGELGFGLLELAQALLPLALEAAGGAYREARQHREKGAKYLVVLTEGGVPSVEQRMPRTRVAG